MPSVLDRIDREWKEKQLNSDEGSAVCDMLFKHYPWKSFCTLTTTDVCSVERMRKIIFRTFELHRPLKGCGYFYALEEFKQRDGVHAHVLVRDAPADHLWTKTWKWYYPKYGVFQSQGMGQDDHFKAAAYVTKYCSKDLGEGTWGFGGALRGSSLAIDFSGTPAKSSGVREEKNVKLHRDRFDLSSSGFGSAAKRSIFRKQKGLDPIGAGLWRLAGRVPGEKKKEARILVDKNGSPRCNA
jgi:hypothetical protein